MENVLFMVDRWDRRINRYERLLDKYQNRFHEILGCKTCPSIGKIGRRLRQVFFLFLNLLL